MSVDGIVCACANSAPLRRARAHANTISRMCTCMASGEFYRGGGRGWRRDPGKRKGGRLSVPDGWVCQYAGLNRTGYLICRYIMEHCGYTVDGAIHAFNAARGHDIEREHYLEHLRIYSSTPSPRDPIQHSLHRRLNYGGRDMQSSISKELGADQPSNTASSSGSSKSRLKQTDLKSKVAHDSHTSYDELSPKKPRRRTERAGGDKRHRVQSATREESAASGSTRSERSQSNDARHKTPSSHRELSSGDLTRRHGQTKVPPLKQRRAIYPSPLQSVKSSVDCSDAGTATDITLSMQALDLDYKD